ncbi:hypothetical protein BX600DRAFT_65728 [Xylariales sp. PMI_506]|nr:hypothetical protein BX600DRAFT_65728 [Xylariales sp. PMI_506]
MASTPRSLNPSKRRRIDIDRSAQPPRPGFSHSSPNFHRRVSGNGGATAGGSIANRGSSDVAMSALLRHPKRKLETKRPAGSDEQKSLPFGWGLSTEDDESDAADTPRKQSPPFMQSQSADDTTTTTTDSSASESTTTGNHRRGAKNSPAKKEPAIRWSDEFPVESRLDEYPADVEIRQLITRLGGLRQKVAVLPGLLKPLSDPLHDFMFEDQDDVTAYEARKIESTLERVQEICQNSVQCSDPTRPVHEAEWNDKVHARVLELALKDSDSLIYHNITQVGIASSLCAPSQSSSKISYGVFLAPPRSSRLKNKISTFLEHREKEMVARQQRHAAATTVSQNSGSSSSSSPAPIAVAATPDLTPLQLNALHSFEPDRPLAISIETKRSGDDPTYGTASHLAFWARSQFRLLKALFPPSDAEAAQRGEDVAGTGSTDTLAASGTVDVAERVATKAVGGDATTFPGMLVHPLIQVDGAAWSLSFAAYEEGLPEMEVTSSASRHGQGDGGSSNRGRVVIYSSLPLGSTSQLSDCYVLVKSLQELAQWCEETCIPWWSKHLNLS